MAGDFIGFYQIAGKTVPKHHVQKNGLAKELFSKPLFTGRNRSPVLLLCPIPRNQIL